jgi:probable addiction module antidote protein
VSSVGHTTSELNVCCGVYSRPSSSMMRGAGASGLAREGLYRALSPGGNPEFATVLKVVRTLGLRLRAGAA